MKPFPIPVVPFGPGSQTEDDTLDYMVMPKGMDTFLPPSLPEKEAIVQLQGAHAALRQTLASLDRAVQGLPAPVVDLAALSDDERRLINQVLGEGEVSARFEVPGGVVLVQEAVFAGVWRVIGTSAAWADGRPDSQADTARGVSDRIEVGRIPLDVLEAAAAVAPVGPGRKLGPAPDAAWPEGVMNAPAVLNELQDHLVRWKPGQEAHVINCTLLPLSPQDLEAIHQALGVGQIQILSRGYGNCRITSTAYRNCWRVTYYNSQDAMILDTIEVADLPEVACAAPEDLTDSHERLADLMAWVTEG